MSLNYDETFDSTDGPLLYGFHDKNGITAAGMSIDKHPVAFGVSLQHVVEGFPAEYWEMPMARLFSWEHVKTEMHRIIYASHQKRPICHATSEDDLLIILTKSKIIPGETTGQYPLEFQKPFEVSYMQETNFSRWKAQSRIWLEGGYLLSDKEDYEALPTINEIAKAKEWQRQTYYLASSSNSGSSYKSTMRDWFSKDTTSMYAEASLIGGVVADNLPEPEDKNQEEKWKWPDYKAYPSSYARTVSEASGTQGTQ